MRGFLMLLSVFALLVTITTSLAHAHSTTAESEIHTSTEAKHNQKSDKLSFQDCPELVCSGCSLHHHHHLASTPYNGFVRQAPEKKKQIFVPEKIDLADLIYGLKRPPKA